MFRIKTVKIKPLIACPQEPNKSKTSGKNSTSNGLEQYYKQVLVLLMAETHSQCLRTNLTHHKYIHYSNQWGWMIWSEEIKWPGQRWKSLAVFYVHSEELLFFCCCYLFLQLVNTNEISIWICSFSHKLLIWKCFILRNDLVCTWCDDDYNRHFVLFICW